MKWISVKERLPDCDEILCNFHIIALYDGESIHVGDDLSCVNVEKHENTHCFYLIEEGNCVTNITHWMEIEPPKDKE